MYTCSGEKPAEANYKEALQLTLMYVLMEDLWIHDDTHIVDIGTVLDVVVNVQTFKKIWELLHEIMYVRNDIFKVSDNVLQRKVESVTECVYVCGWQPTNNGLTP